MYGIVDGFKGMRGPLVAATDAGYKAKTAGMAFVVSDGRWGLRRWVRAPRLDPTGPSAVLIAELRAVAYLCEDPHGRLPDELLMDSASGIRYLRIWQAGGTGRMPPGYSLRQRWGHPTGEPTLVRLARIMASNPGLVIRHVHSHTGHPLNEAADSLASIARRGEPAEQTRSRATCQVEAFLPAWHKRRVSGSSATERAATTQRICDPACQPPVFAPRSLSPRPQPSAKAAAA
jgi:ribonuclease HI